ncbi:trypsin-like peptidase domain-containing protein [Mycobacterium deserti]|uniref:Serine protease n=1 Tax=Mycobacterium deserti TaxID=2978347 RepID=A0ABT2MA99_9MYCO|nr:trypsin-like peptidase domain-containing protein [Mycobacterium deserti]MCT7658095.1 trypsin-like peptidase domain-containing protein [Mycobacterium deserti]
MRRMRVAPSAIALILSVAVALSGCSGLQDREAPTAAQAPDPALAQDQVVGLVRPSVLKIRAEAKSCNKLLSGTGFVVGKNRVLTNAHVVAGGDAVTVENGDKDSAARVVSFDPDADIAVLDVPDLAAPPLVLAGYEAKSGAEALVLGFPGAGEFAAMPARIREVNNLDGPNIYQTTNVIRPVYIYTVAGEREFHGGSGSPLIDMTGRVLGVVFGNDVQNATTGFALTSAKTATLLPADDAYEPVATGACLS